MTTYLNLRIAGLTETAALRIARKYGEYLSKPAIAEDNMALDARKAQGAEAGG